MREIVVPGPWERVVELASSRRREVLVVAGFVGVLVLGGMASFVRGTPARVAPPAPAVSIPQATTSPAVPGPVVLVHVSGAVMRPGLYQLPAGARVADAIEAAGGPRPAADLGALNLAEVVLDATKVDVIKRGEVLAAVPPAGSVAGTVVHLNNADQAALETVPGLGPVKAGAIVQHRQEIGGFTSIDQLLDVVGIGPSTLEAIRPYVAL
ncbi:MAG: ComEA family DNA-binding protein [Actinomycetota bacterium]|nr:ComEA family DNA-binding protein [Actinomycetota bacterium]